MLPYLLLIGGSLVPPLARVPRRRFLPAMGLACWLLASLRYVTGFDYRSYEAIFQTAAGGLSGFGGWRVEPGYLLLNLAVAGLGGDYRAFLFVFHLLFTVLVFAWIGRYSPSPWMSVYLFLTLQYFALSMNLLRQALAAAVILWTYPFLRSRRVLPYCGVALLAACFHWTALVTLPFYFLLNLRASRLHYGLAALAAGTAYVLIDPLTRAAAALLPMYSFYLGGRFWQANSLVYVLLPLGCFLFALPLFRRTARGGSESPALGNSVFYSLLMQLFITRHFILERLSVYIAFFSLLALPEAALIPSRKCSARARTIILLAGGFVYFLFAASQGFHGVYPFHGVWDRAAS